MIECTSCGYHYFSPEIDDLQCINRELLEALDSVAKSLALAAPKLGVSWELPEIKQARAIITKAKGLCNE